MRNVHFVHWVFHQKSQCTSGNFALVRGEGKGVRGGKSECEGRREKEVKGRREIKG